MSDPAGSRADDIRVACIQYEPRIGDLSANLARTLELIREAASQGAALVVLPELANSGYVFELREEAFRCAESLPDGACAKAWAEIAKELHLHIVAGIAEREGHRLFNSALVAGPDGFIGTYRKLHLWDRENLIFEPGNLGLPVFDTKFGRIGVAICYDGWFPETFRSLAINGADIVCVPTNWVPMPNQNPSREAMANILHMAAAHSNAIFIACADRIGTERGQSFEGQSLIVGPSGWAIAGPASRDAEEILCASVNLSTARSSRQLNGFNQLLRDRRTDVYGVLPMQAQR